MSHQRVFITGIGFVTPHGEDPAAAFDLMVRGESRVRRVRSGTPELGSDVLLAPVEFDPGETIPKLQRLFMARAAQMAVVAAHGALMRARLLENDCGPADAGLYLGCGLGGAEALQRRAIGPTGRRRAAVESRRPCR